MSTNNCQLHGSGHGFSLSSPLCQDAHNDAYKSFGRGWHSEREVSSAAGERNNRPTICRVYRMCSVCAIFLGVVLLVPDVSSVRLFGVTCAQGFVYFRRHSQDHARLKSFVSRGNWRNYKLLTGLNRSLPCCKALLSRVLADVSFYSLLFVDFW